MADPAIHQWCSVSRAIRRTQALGASSPQDPHAVPGRQDCYVEQRWCLLAVFDMRFAVSCMRYACESIFCHPFSVFCPLNAVRCTLRKNALRKTHDELASFLWLPVTGFWLLLLHPTFFTPYASRITSNRSLDSSPGSSLGMTSGGARPIRRTSTLHPFSLLIGISYGSVCGLLYAVCLRIYPLFLIQHLVSRI